MQNKKYLRRLVVTNVENITHTIINSHNYKTLISTVGKCDIKIENDLNKVYDYILTKTLVDQLGATLANMEYYETFNYLTPLYKEIVNIIMNFIYNNIPIHTCLNIIAIKTVLINNELHIYLTERIISGNK